MARAITSRFCCPTTTKTARERAVSSELSACTPAGALGIQAISRSDRPTRSERMQDAHSETAGTLANDARVAIGCRVNSKRRTHTVGSSRIVVDVRVGGVQHGALGQVVAVADGVLLGGRGAHAGASRR